MTVLEPRDDDDVLALQPVIRRHNATKLKALIELLEPQVDGSYGPVNPRMVEVYMKALRELGQLYRVHDRPPPPKEEDEGLEERRMEVLREQAERQLRELSDRAQPL